MHKRDLHRKQKNVVKEVPSKKKTKKKKKKRHADVTEIKSIAGGVSVESSGRSRSKYDVLYNL